MSSLVDNFKPKAALNNGDLSNKYKRGEPKLKNEQVKIEP